MSKMTGNMDIIYIQSYNGSYIPVNKVKLVTADPNTGLIISEVMLSDILEHVMYKNLHDFEKIKNRVQDFKENREIEVLESSLETQFIKLNKRDNIFQKLLTKLNNLLERKLF